MVTNKVSKSWHPIMKDVKKKIKSKIEKKGWML